MTSVFGDVRDLTAFTDPDAALARLSEIYDAGTALVMDGLTAMEGEGLSEPVDACYPMLGFRVGEDELDIDARHAFGVALDPGIYATTITRPRLFARYLREQIALIIDRHHVPVHVGVSDTRLPLPFVAEGRMIDLAPEAAARLQRFFAFPDLRRMDDSIANGTHEPAPGAPRPMALFSAERVDYSLARLKHYTGSAPEHVQSFVLLTNYQRYVDRFVEYAMEQVGRDGYTALVQPGDVITGADRIPSAALPPQLPQMPAYHLTREDGQGISLINIGVGPSNAKTITDHLAVLRPHCWLMVGHCAGLRRSQQLGDYVLAHGYVRDDQVLDDDLPQWVPVPPIAEVQVALGEAAQSVTGLRGAEMKTRVRTGTVYSTADRNWELQFKARATALNQGRAIAVDMESATIAANGFRFRVPYGTLLCVSDKPVHGEIKLGGVADAFYRERVRQHLEVGIETLRILRAEGVNRLHSRKLRSFDEPPMR
jgi:AMP nucleosidase